MKVSFTKAEVADLLAKTMQSDDAPIVLKNDIEQIYLDLKKDGTVDIFINEQPPNKPGPGSKKSEAVEIPVAGKGPAPHAKTISEREKMADMRERRGGKI